MTKSFFCYGFLLSFSFELLCSFKAFCLPRRRHWLKTRCASRFSQLQRALLRRTGNSCKVKGAECRPRSKPGCVMFCMTSSQMDKMEKGAPARTKSVSLTARAGLSYSSYRQNHSQCSLGTTCASWGASSIVDEKAVCEALLAFQHA